jgi:hypothetical protein
MKSRFTPHLIDLTFDAALRSFWRKSALSSFLRTSGIGKIPAWGPDESKRDYLTRVFEALRGTDAGRSKIMQLAQFLAEQRSFPDLKGWEDSAQKLEGAEQSVVALRSYLEEQDLDIATEQSRQEARKRLRTLQEEARVAQQSIQALTDRLTQLSVELGTPDAGRGFESWFYALMQFSEITARKPYTVDGRQIDGSVTIGDTTYLVECKFTAEQSGAPDIDVFRAKVESKADNTMGIFVSISGFSSVALNAASGKKTPLLLLDHTHIYGVLSGAYSFRTVIERVRRHCSQTGHAHLAIADFGG